MNKKSGTSKDAADKLVRGIKRKTRKNYSSEEKIRIVLAGLRGEEVAAFAFHVRGDGAAPLGALHGVGFPITEAGARGDDSRSDCLFNNKYEAVSCHRSGAGAHTDRDHWSHYWSAATIFSSESRSCMTFRNSRGTASRACAGVDIQYLKILVGRLDDRYRKAQEGGA